jgi:hypothetical protein
MGRRNRGSRHPPGRPKIPLVQQLVNMRRLHPGFHIRIERGILVSEGHVQPTALTQRYGVRIEYDGRRWPRAYVLDPALRRRSPAQRIAHSYSDTEPCLFTPAHRDWDRSMYVGHTIVPWLMEWIVFYETWLLTGEWLGGGTLPPEFDKPVAQGEPEA